ncbi:MAG: hypothetical protein AAF193_03220, partial [Bacteroidota bacterium]
FAAPEISFNLPESICDNATLELNALPENGLFSGEGVANGVLDPALLSPDDTEVTYTVTSLDNCTSSSTQSISVIQAAITGGEWSTFDIPPCGGELSIEITGIENFDDWSVELPEEWGAQSEFGSDPIAFTISDVFTDGQVIVTANNECGTSEVFTNSVELEDVPSSPVLQSITTSWCEGQSRECLF